MTRRDTTSSRYHAQPSHPDGIDHPPSPPDDAATNTAAPRPLAPRGATEPPATPPHPIQFSLPGRWHVNLFTPKDQMRDWRTAIQQIITDPTALPDYRLLKYSPDAEVFAADLTLHAATEGEEDNTQPIVAKRFRPHGWRAIITALLRPTRARRALTRTRWLHRAGIPTPLPLAILECRWPRRESWLVTEYVPDLTDLDELAMRHLPRLAPHRRRKTKDAIINAVAAALHNLETAGLTHRDWKASNILACQAVHDDLRGPHRQSRGRQPADTPVASRTVRQHAADQPELWILDLDGLHRTFAPARHRWPPVIRLAASLADTPAVTRTDLARLIRTRLEAAGHSPDTWRNYLRTIARRVTEYNRRAVTRKRHKLDGYTGAAAT